MLLSRDETYEIYVKLPAKYRILNKYPDIPDIHVLCFEKIVISKNIAIIFGIDFWIYTEIYA